MGRKLLETEEPVARSMIDHESFIMQINKLSPIKSPMPEDKDRIVWLHRNRVAAETLLSIFDKENEAGFLARELVFNLLEEIKSEIAKEKKDAI